MGLILFDETNELVPIESTTFQEFRVANDNQVGLLSTYRNTNDVNLIIPIKGTLHRLCFSRTTNTKFKTTNCSSVTKEVFRAEEVWT